MAERVTDGIQFDDLAPGDLIIVNLRDGSNCVGEFISFGAGNGLRVMRLRTARFMQKSRTTVIQTKAIVLVRRLDHAD